ncbi:3'(2'),5'-bisphosphate nucleotidase CysQ [Bradyrhizobium guangzhouense]|uniref:3'(2'),5'-bisphosphate nucleotidase CysQ n=1 Tax=Bradyrhizobium guangzhouense TaxID=1325095 RepID=UPI001009E61E|nr:3'(2'),5'-bisphosphate nucleotidase CysQ [Bradyrhizobium guangzhouense]RXH06465.1 3'(2'),5'-bisphosphate nucleotidase [Bradyrhizobium guangzhouense]
MEEDLHEADRIARLFGLIAVRAGSAIMQVRSAASDPQYKSDGSPVTEADLQADEIIRSCLKRNLPDVAVITEETWDAAATQNCSRFILVDPLDGTKEFIRGTPEFTVNIALVENGSPMAGAVYAPALCQLYLGGTNAYKLHVEPGSAGPEFSDMHPICVQCPSAEGLRAVTSRSHLDDATKSWIGEHVVRELKPSGSSLKFCVVAEGEADVYPRLAPTMEWDTAAGHAVLLAAGGRVVGLDGGLMQYGKPAYRNSEFIAWGGSPAT